MRLVVYGRFGSFCLPLFHDLFFPVFFCVFYCRSAIHFFISLSLRFCFFYVPIKHTHMKIIHWMFAHTWATIENHHFCTSFSSKISINHLMFVHFSHWFSHLCRYEMYACDVCMMCDVRVSLVYWHFPNHTIRLQFIWIYRMFMILLAE